MKKRHDDLVRFIRQTFGAAIIALVVVAAVFLALFYLRAADEGWTRHSGEVTRLARDIEARALQRHSVVYGHLLGGNPPTLDAIAAGRPALFARLDSLRSITADEPTQQARADGMARAFAKWDSALAIPSKLSHADPAHIAAERAAIVAADPIFRDIAAATAEFLIAEEAHYETRLSDTHAVDRVIVVSVLGSLAIVLASLFLIRRRLLAQAQDAAIGAAALDLRNAQLIDQTVQLERQQAELENQATQLQQALRDLESQKTDLQLRSAELQQIVDALQASDTRFRTLVDSLHDVVFTLGIDHRYTGMYGGVSAAETAHLDGYIGKTATEILGADLGRSHVEAAGRALSGESVTYEWSMPTDTRSRYYTATISPLRGPGGEIHGVVGINREITEQVVRDKALSDARDQLRQSQRLDALGQLAGGVAHDFNNLLTVIITYAAILLEEAEPGSDEARSVEEIRRASERAAGLTRQLLAFSRRQVLQPQAIDLNSTVREVERMLRRILPPDVQLEIDADDSIGLVMADPGQIEQVLVNLAINARDAMPDGGQLTIATSSAESPAGPPGERSVPQVVITVSDTGVGMSPEVAAKAFDPFFTTKDVGKGTGLGLATVHGIIEQSGGTVSMQSVLGRGTTFLLRFPRLADGVDQPQPTVRPTSELNGTEAILLIDDNEELRRVVKRMLTRAGYHVIEAANGVAALTQLDRGIHVDIVLSDVMMPEMGGRAVVDAVRQRHRTVKLLLMSGYNYDTALRGMAQRGDVAFIEKPFTAEKLLRKIRDVLGHSADRGIALTAGRPSTP